MRSIKKYRLSRKELWELCTFFSLGDPVSYRFVPRGNINSNYVVQTQKGKFVLRVYNMKSAAHVFEEQRIVGKLRAKGFFAPAFFEVIGDANGHPVVCYPYIEGSHPLRIDTATLRRVGRLCASLHTVSKGMRSRLTGEGLDQIRTLLKIASPAIMKSRFKQKNAFLSFLEEELRTIQIPQLPQGIVHVDIKQENIVVQGSRWSLIDFDNAYTDALVVDVASCIMWWCFSKNKLDENKKEVLLAGYEDVRKLSRTEHDALDAALRFNLLKQALKYAYICLARLDFAQKHAWSFVEKYKSL